MNQKDLDRIEYLLGSAMSIGLHVRQLDLPHGFAVEIFFGGHDSDTNARAYSLCALLDNIQEEARRKYGKQLRTVGSLTDTGRDAPLDKYDQAELDAIRSDFTYENAERRIWELANLLDSPGADVGTRTDAFGRRTIASVRFDAVASVVAAATTGDTERAEERARRVAFLLWAMQRLGELSRREAATVPPTTEGGAAR